MTWAEHLAPVDEEHIREFLDNMPKSYGLPIHPQLRLLHQKCLLRGDARDLDHNHTSIFGEPSKHNGDLACQFDYQKIGAIPRDKWIGNETKGLEYYHEIDDPRDPELDAAYFKVYPQMQDLLH